jgi:hypothetical protein
MRTEFLRGNLKALGRQRRKWDDNMKMILTEAAWEDGR